MNQSVSCGNRVQEKKESPMFQADNSEAASRTERLLRVGPRQVFAAFERPDLLARWWGPSGFTNTFEQFAFKPGGRWVFVMHGPNGASYPNECVFREILPDARIVIDHVVAPLFTLTVNLTPEYGATRISWVQEFESPEVAARLRPIVDPANEQNLDRLQALLAEDVRPAAQ